jgi:cobalt-zinc-cadmium efflux system membrane fusion protein
MDTMNKLKYIPAILFLIISCSGEKPKEQIADVPTISSNANVVVLTSEQISAIKLKSGKIELRNITNVIKANGYLDVPPQNKAVVSPRISGYVSKINFLIGDNVRKGQVMAELESMDFIDMQQAYIKLNARIAYLKDDFERQKFLLDQDAVSRKKYLMSEADYKTAISTLNGLTSKLSLLGVDFQKLKDGNIVSKNLLRAPISGSVKAMNTVIGKHIEASDEIFEIINPDHLHLELSVYEKDVIDVKKGQKVWFKMPSMENKIFEGEVFLVGKDLSEDKRSINVHVHIEENQATFSVGMYANATIVIEDNPCYTLPVTALVIDGNSKYIFKQSESSGGNSTFTKIPIITGKESDGLIELASMEGLMTDDVIVTDGAFYLLNAFSETE